MKEVIVTAIAAGGQDYKEADKMIKLITAEEGVINALMKGVKKEKAKLKFAAMPFSFCQYQLIDRNGFYSVINASPLENLFDISYNPDSFVVGSLMLEVAATAMGGEARPDIFLYLLSGLKMLLYSSVDAYSIGVNFVCRIMVRGGHYALTPADAPYAVEIDQQQSLSGDAVRLLKQLATRFQDKYFCKLKSLSML